MSQTDSPTDEELELVARHGSNDLTRALATVQLARRKDRLDELATYAGGDP